MSVLLKIENLHVEANGKEILKGVNFKIKAGEIQALLGPNASGKTVLSQVILGNPKYKITNGKIFFQEKEISKLPPEKRIKLGMSLAWQSPPAIKGVKLSQILEKISMLRGSGAKQTSKHLNAKHLKHNLNESKYFSKEQKFLEIESLFLDRELNVDFSGGEKKLSELLQILFLKPKLVIFDEIDSGLDIKKLKKVSEIIKKEFLNKKPKTSILFITHSGAILNFFKPKITNVIVGGKIICKEKNYKKVLKVIKKYGYEKCKKCKLLAD